MLRFRVNPRIREEAVQHLTERDLAMLSGLLDTYKESLTLEEIILSLYKASLKEPRR